MKLLFQRILNNLPVAGSSLRQELTKHLSILALTTFLVGGGVIGLFTWRLEANTWRGLQSEAAHRAARTVQTFILHSQDLLGSIAVINPAVLAENSTHASDPNLLENQLKRAPAFLELLRVARHGQVLASADRGYSLLANGDDIAHSPWFLAAQSGQTFQGNLSLSTQNEPYLILSVPAADGGVVAGVLRMDVLQEVVADIQFGRDGRILILSQDGVVLAHTLPGLGHQEIPEVRQFELTMPLRQTNQEWLGEYTSILGGRVVGALVPVSGTQWTVLAELPVAEAFAGSRTTLAILAGVMLLMAVVMVSLGQREVHLRLFAPLDTLRAGVERIGQGDIEYRLSLDSAGEIRAVARAVNQMAQNLQDRQRELKLHSMALANEITERKRVAAELQTVNAELEARVRDRTRAIEIENTERKQAEADLRHHVESLLLLNRVVSAGASTLEPKHILEILCMELAQALGLKQVIFSLLDDGRTCLTVIAEYRTPDLASAVGTVIPLAGNSITQKVLETRRPAVLCEVPFPSKHVDVQDENGSLAENATLLIVPMVIRDQVIGTLGLDAFDRREFCEQDISLVQFVTTAAGQIFDNARLYAELQRELVERIRVESQLHYQSTHDSLTDLYNRSYFEEEILKLGRNQHAPIGVIMIDVDHMKEVNDTLGHAAGDEYLRQTGRVLRRSFRQEDMVARIGGDEFAVFLPETDEAGLEMAMNRVRMNALRMQNVGGLPPLCLSIGGATSQPGEPLLDALHLADRNMYLEKARNRVGESSEPAPLPRYHPD